eukprot:4922030-Amphidinium_carterae.1
MASSAPLAPKPKPSSAPTEVEVGDISLPQAAQTAEEVTSPMYSPISPPQTVDSSSSDSSDSEPEMPDWMSLTHGEALDKLCIHSDSVIEYAADELHKFWTQDAMHSTFEMLAPTWLQAFKDHTL